MGDLLYNTIFIMYSFITTHCVIVVIFSTIIQWTPLHTSSIDGHAQVVDMLLSQPGIVVDSRDKVCALTNTHTGCGQCDNVLC